MTSPVRNDAARLNSMMTTVSSMTQQVAIISDGDSPRIVDEVEEQASIQREDHLLSLCSTVTEASISHFTIPDEECQSCRSSRWTHVPHQFGSFTSKVFGQAAHAVVDPILDRQKKKKFLQPILDRARRL